MCRVHVNTHLGLNPISLYTPKWDVLCYIVAGCGAYAQFGILFCHAVK